MHSSWYSRRVICGGDGVGVRRTGADSGAVFSRDAVEANLDCLDTAKSPLRLDTFSAYRPNWNMEVCRKVLDDAQPKSIRTRQVVISDTSPGLALNFHQFQRALSLRNIQLHVTHLTTTNCSTFSLGLRSRECIQTLHQS